MTTSPLALVTIDNLVETLPSWDASDTNHLYAIVDMGRQETLLPIPVAIKKEKKKNRKWQKAHKET